MGQVTSIPWTHHTFNGWRGCVEVSEGCAFCYARIWARRNPGIFGEWGATARRVIAPDSYWRTPFKWDRDAREAGERRRVFAFSLADWLEMREDLHAPRARLLGTIAATPGLDWLLVTKRAENWRSALGHAWNVSPTVPGPSCVPMVARWLDGDPPPNVWMGVTAENRRWLLERGEHLRSIPARIKFVSAEPLLGDLVGLGRNRTSGLIGIDWLILGGESGDRGKARACRIEWIRNGIDLARAMGAAVFVKQLGSEYARAIGLKDVKGEDPAEWPEDLRIREFPDPSR